VPAALGTGGRSAGFVGRLRREELRLTMDGDLVDADVEGRGG
jgi:hypothetical protein